MPTSALSRLLPYSCIAFYGSNKLISACWKPDCLFSSQVPQQRPRVASAAGQTSSKLAVPRPVNLPSLRKEHGGNDPSTQIVAPGGTQGWNKPSEETAAGAPGLSPLLGGTAKPGSGRIGSGPWQSAGQPGGPPLQDTLSGPNSHAFPPLDAKTARLNASDYPTLGAGTAQGPSSFASSRPSRTASEPLNRNFNDSRPWQEDERGPGRFGGGAGGTWWVPLPSPCKHPWP